MLLGNVSEKELDELNNFANRQNAITVMFKRCIEEQEQLERDRNAYLIGIRSRLNINENTDITIDHKTGEVTEIPAEGVI
jgi:predicted TIM-barrel fold metal-dependent hydrolase